MEMQCIKSRNIVVLKDRILIPILYREIFLYKDEKGDICPIVVPLDAPDNQGIEEIRRENGELVYPVSLDVVEIDEYYSVFRTKDSIIIINYYYGEKYRKVLTLNNVEFFIICHAYGDQYKEHTANKKNKVIELTPNYVAIYRTEKEENDV